MRVLQGGSRGPTVLPLHGLGATADVWAGLVGHGESEPLPHYTFATVAEAVAPLVDPAGTVVLGHSFGGVAALLG
ncbi:alpha/beta fold hydrolase [Pseudonocardia sp. WMMC193]|uniref:alpha/beta fold hydrolase n=1 Tax=Pseudonocardia sp. WMMC193 TaxID=2911965 RepID=UPI001F31AA3A|nr:alpha/beta hydrolase [Pseudonocardia sp. WMMC193]MCF7552469.1 alpha/beta hydrolase [Pseudonocardia sp. WMMC193]